MVSFVSSTLCSGGGQEGDAYRDDRGDRLDPEEPGHPRRGVAGLSRPLQPSVPAAGTTGGGRAIPARLAVGSAPPIDRTPDPSHGGVQPHAVRAMQQFLSEGSWDDTALLHRRWPEVDRELAEDDGVLI